MSLKHDIVAAKLFVVILYFALDFVDELVVGFVRLPHFSEDLLIHFVVVRHFLEVMELRDVMFFDADWSKGEPEGLS